MSLWAGIARAAAIMAYFVRISCAEGAEKCEKSLAQKVNCADDPLWREAPCGAGRLDPCFIAPACFHAPSNTCDKRFPKNRIRDILAEP
jgi:hypothetical protein